MRATKNRMSGFSIPETMVSVAIVGILTMVLASAVMAAIESQYHVERLVRVREVTDEIAVVAQENQICELHFKDTAVVNINNGSPAITGIVLRSMTAAGVLGIGDANKLFEAGKTVGRGVTINKIELFIENMVKPNLYFGRLSVGYDLGGKFLPYVERSVDMMVQLDATNKIVTCGKKIDGPTSGADLNLADKIAIGQAIGVIPFPGRAFYGAYGGAGADAGAPLCMMNSNINQTLNTLTTGEKVFIITSSPVAHKWVSKSTGAVGDPRPWAPEVNAPSCPAGYSQWGFCEAECGGFAWPASSGWTYCPGPANRAFNSRLCVID